MTIIHATKLMFTTLLIITSSFVVHANDTYQSQCNVTQASIKNWLVKPDFPTQVSGGQSNNCDFYQLGWQQFFNVTQQHQGAYNFTRWGTADGLFPSQKAPGPYPGDSSKNLLISEIRQAASLVPLVDRNGRWIHYSVMTNKPQWDSVLQNQAYINGCYDKWGHTYFDKFGGPDATAAEIAALPTLKSGSSELKLAWRVLETCTLPDSPQNLCVKEDPSRFITLKTHVEPYSYGALSHRVDDVLLGLVGIHIITKTDQQPDWVWSTFEHRDNVPYCDGQSDQQDYLFYDNKGSKNRDNMFCTSCPVDIAKWQTQIKDPTKPYNKDTNPYLKDFTLSLADDDKAILNQTKTQLICTLYPEAFKYANPPLYDGKQCELPLIPTQVCREKPMKNIPAETDTAQVKTLNNTVLKTLQQLDNKAQNTALENYQHIGTMWFDDNCRTNTDCQLQGITSLTNTTMETFEQQSNCTVCHGKNQFNPMPFPSKPYAQGLADRAFIFQHIKQFGNCPKPLP